MIVRWFLGWPMLGCRPTSDCRSNRRRKANASIPNPGEPLRWSQAVRIRAPCSAVRGRVPVSGIFRPRFVRLDLLCPLLRRQISEHGKISFLSMVA
jgi:hypothetical protein